MKRIKHKILITFLVLTTLFISRVKAQVYTHSFDGDSLIIPDTYILKTKGSIFKYQKLTVLQRIEDGRFVYCIQPGTALSTNPITGYDENLESVSGLSKEQIERIKLLSYYGYGYNNHSDTKWYSVTQFMIWKTESRGYEINFTETLNGKIITKYIDEMNEMEYLINNHYKTPSFNNDKITLQVGQTIELIDNENVLNNYDVNMTGALTVTKENNKLKITADKIGTYNITLTKNSIYSNNPAVYIDSVNQDVFLPGKLDDVYSYISIEVTGQEMSIHKIGEELILENDTYNYKEIDLRDVMFGLYNDKDEILGALTTDSNGKINFSNLEIGKYYIKELQTTKNHILDDTKYYFEIDYITDNTKNITIQIKNLLPKGDLEFIKTDEEDSRLPGIEIEIYNEDDILIYRGATDENGEIKVLNIPLGEYYIKETKTKEGYILSIEKLYFNINSDKEVVTVTMINEKEEQITTYIEIVTEVPDTGLEANNNLSYIFTTIGGFSYATYKKNKIFNS